MSLDKEVSEKLATLDKIKEEIIGFTEMKSNLVKDINAQLLKAKGEADNIIANAENTAKKILSGAGKIQDEAIEYSNASKLKADEYLHNAEKSMQEVKNAQIKLVEEKEMLNILTIAHNNNVKASGEKFAKIEKDLNERQACLDSKEITIRTLENQHNKKRIAQQKAEEIRLIKEAEIIAKQKDLDLGVATLIKDKKIVDAQKVINTQTLSEIKAAQDKIIIDTKTNEEAKTDIEQQQRKIDEKNKILTAQFDLLQDTNKQLEEKKISLKEQEQLITIKDRDVESKIRILTELRMKGQS